MKPEPELSQLHVRSRTATLLLLGLFLTAAASGCGRAIKDVSVEGVKQGQAAPKPDEAPQKIVRTWLGVPERNRYGSGPIPNKPFKIMWQIKTGYISGPNHHDGWGGTSWPGQPTVTNERVYYPSADGNIYAVNIKDGSVLWKFKGNDSFKAAPTLISGDRIIANGLDTYIYCLNASDGSLNWKYKTGFEIDGSVMERNGMISFGGEDHNLYGLNLSDGSLLYKIPLGGSTEGSGTAVDGRVYIGTEAGQLYCFDQATGKQIWQSPIGEDGHADSDSTPAVTGGFVYTAAEDGYVRCYRQDNGAQVWKWKSDPGGAESKGRGGFWASPILVDGRLYIGSDNGFFYCLTDKGEMVWKTRMHMAVWGSSPIVDGKIIVGDKAGWLNMLDPKDGHIMQSIKIGDSVNATPAILNGRIYVGAFMGEMYCIGFED